MKNFIKLLIIFMLPPFFSFIYFLKKFYRIPKKNSLFLAISTGSIFLLMIPMYDAIYFYNSYVFLRTLPIKYFLTIEKNIYHCLYYFFSFFIEYWHIYSIIVIFILYIWNKTFVEIIDKKNRFYGHFFIIFIFCLYPREVLDLTRYFLASVLYLYFIVKFYKTKERKYFLLMFLLFFIHHSFIIFILLFYISTFLKKINLKSFYFLNIIFFLSFIKILEKSILKVIIIFSKNFSPTLSERITGYMLNQKTILGLLKESRAETLKFTWTLFILIIVGFLLSYLILKIYKFKSFIDYLILEILFFNFFFIDKNILYERVFIIFILLTVIWLCLQTKLKKKALIFFQFLILLNSFFFTVYYIPNFYIKGQVAHLLSVKTAQFEIYKAFYVPTFITITKNKYTDFWIEKWRVK